MNLMSSIRRGTLAVAILVLAACGAPSETQRQASALKDSLTTTETFIGEQREAYSRRLQATDADVRTVAERERLSSRFDAALGELERARTLHEQEVRPFRSARDPQELQRFQRGLTGATAAVDQARRIAQEPEARLVLLTRAKQESAAWFAQVPQLVAAAQSDLASVQTLAARYERTHPARQDAIRTRFAPGPQTMQTIETGATAVSAQQALAARNTQLDYGALATGYQAVTDGRTGMQTLRTRLERELPQLDRAYSKVLSDMRETYTVCVTRTSWQENAYDDFPRETAYDYPCQQVSEDAFEAAEAFADYEYDFATYSQGWGGEPNIRHGDIGQEVTSDQTAQLWRELGINPTLAFPQGDNSASFEIREATATYFHRYTLLENRQRTTGDWEQVSEEFYEQHWGNLGLAIVEKPYGAFDDEAVTTGVPPGMTLVGDTRAGEWRSDGNGGNIWFWLYWHQALYGNHYGPDHRGYSRAEWDDWRRRRNQGAYTGMGPTPTYGSAGSATRTGPSASSDFARRGGFRQASADIRGAGPRGRSGGPQSGK